MAKLISLESKKAGLPPGTPVHLGEKKTDHCIITIFDYTPAEYVEKCVKSVEESFPFKDKDSVTWINIDGLQELDVIEKIDSHFGVHPLVLEDIVNTGQRPKMEDFGEYIFLVLKMLRFDQSSNDIVSEQVSLIVGPNYVISFQEETKGDVFDPIRDRIRNNKGRVRKNGADYLAYVLLDSIVDNYFIVLERMGEEIEALEDALMEEPSPNISQRIHMYKRNMIFLRKQIWPLRELVSGLQRTESKLIKKTTGIFLRDLYDHIIQVMDTIDSYRDILGGMQEIYLSSISTRMNEVMKFLTMFASIFIPLTFIAGVYGMNFENMPELKSKWGYFIVLSVMALVTIGMLFYFRKKKWL